MGKEMNLVSNSVPRRLEQAWENPVYERGMEILSCTLTGRYLETFFPTDGIVSLPRVKVQARHAAEEQRGGQHMNVLT